METVDAWIEQVHLIITVVATKPSPIDMHESFIVVTVEDKGMSSPTDSPKIVGTGVHHGAVVTEFVKDNLHPTLIVVEGRAVEQLGIGKAEMRLETHHGTV